MAVYAIGDVHGCLMELERLLTRIDFTAGRDRLWFVGDLINRGPHSLEVVALVRSLGDGAITLLGNHEMRALAMLAGSDISPRHRAYMAYLWEKGDAEDLRSWLAGLPLMAWEPELGYAMVHAGIHPSWTLKMAWQRAHSAGTFCASSSGLPVCLQKGIPPPPMEPDTSQPTLRHWYQTMTFTSLRLCTAEGMALWPGQAASHGLDKCYLWPPDDSPFRPWFDILHHPLESRLLYGHWAAAGLTLRPNTLGLDTGCVYGGQLTALRLDSAAPLEERLFQVESHPYAEKDD